MAQLVGVEDGLSRFLAEYSPLAWSPGGKVDCCLALAAWLMWNGFPDPAAPLRGSYEDEAGFRLIIAEHGGVVPLVEVHLPPQCLPASHPERGAIGVLGSPTNMQRQFGAIFDGDGWLVRVRAGFERVYARKLMSWSVPCRS